MAALPTRQPPTLSRVYRGSSRLGSWLERQPLRAWVAGAIVLALALRAPWAAEPLGNDEGGLLYVASEWRSGGLFPYGDYFLDRPPLLLLVFLMAAEVGGAEAIRATGAVAAIALVPLIALVARELGGERAARWAALLAAGLGSSLALHSVFTPSELIAVVPSTASVLLLLLAIRRPKSRRPCLAAAGALAVCALLVKQSFGDALVAGVAFLAASALLRRPATRDWLFDAAAYLAGGFAPLTGVVLWAGLTDVSANSLLYAVLGFRLDALGALSGSPGDVAGRLAIRLLLPLAASGLLVVALWSLPGLRSLRGRPVVRATVAAWGLAGLVAILLGGSYWLHYLIQLVPFVAVTGALGMCLARARAARLTAGALAALAAGGLLIGPSVRQATSSEIGPSEVGAFVGDRARAGDTVYVRYSQPNVTYYSGLRNPYPYQWSLMVRTFPDAEPRLRSLLASKRRPTWLVEWEDGGAYGLDRSGATQRVIDRRYRQVATVCGVPVLLERDVVRPRGDPTAAPDCGQATFLPTLP